MTKYVIEFFGHCSDPPHDKLWGWVRLEDDTLLNFWGTRGEKLTYKRYFGYSGEAKLARLRSDKTRRYRKNGTYVGLEETDIETIWPNWRNEFEKGYVLALMFGQLHGEQEDNGLVT